MHGLSSVDQHTWLQCQCWHCNWGVMVWQAVAAWLHGAQAPLNSRVRLLTVWSYCFYRQGRTQDSHRILGPVHKRQFHTYWWKIPRGYVCQYNSNMSVSLISPPKLFVLQLDLVKIPYLSLLSALQQMPEVRHRRPWPGWVFCRVQHWALRSMTNTGLLKYWVIQSKTTPPLCIAPCRRICARDVARPTVPWITPTRGHWSGVLALGQRSAGFRRGSSCVTPHLANIDCPRVGTGLTIWPDRDLDI